MEKQQVFEEARKKLHDFVENSNCENEECEILTDITEYPNSERWLFYAVLRDTDTDHGIDGDDTWFQENGEWKCKKDMISWRYFEMRYTPDGKWIMLDPIKREHTDIETWQRYKV
jgi:hypothetical protein